MGWGPLFYQICVYVFEWAVCVCGGRIAGRGVLYVLAHSCGMCDCVCSFLCASHGEDLTNPAGVGSTAMRAGEMLVCAAHQACFAERKARVIEALRPQHSVSG